MKQTKHTIKLTLNDNNQWLMAKDMEYPKGPGNYPKLKVESDDTGVFTFKIHNAKGVVFAEAEPFAPKSGTNPPDFKDQFTWTGEGTKELTVKDANANKDGGAYPGGVYNYELRFSNAPTLDPIITNNGCCQSFFGSNLIMFSLGIAAVVALYFFVIKPILARRSAS